MKKNTHLFFAFTIITTFCFAQKIPSTISVISAQGGFDKTESISLEWTLGENFIETVSLEDNIFTQGFHQSFSSASTLAIDPIPENLFKSVVYPNPVNSLLNINLTTSEESKYKISLYEITGRFIKQSSVNTKDSSITINVTDLSSGMYILQISNSKGSLIETHKIIKH
jgi:hypothetical protein